MKGLLLFALCHVVIFAQEAPRPIVLAPALGDTIDAVEREWYQLLPAIPGFEKAVFYLNADSTLQAHVFFEKEKKRSDTIFQLHRSLISMRNQITQIRKVRDDLSPDDPDGEDALFRVGNGREVQIELMNNFIIEGEMISVRTNSLVINTGVHGDKSFCSKGTLVIVYGSEMKSICFSNRTSSFISTLEWVASATVGAVLGAMIGSQVGFTIDQAYNNHKNHPYMALGIEFGLFGGAIVGLVIRDFVLDNDEEYTTNTLYLVVKELRSYSRYPDREPACLRMKK